MTSHCVPKQRARQEVLTATTESVHNIWVTNLIDIKTFFFEENNAFQKSRRKSEPFEVPTRDVILYSTEIHMLLWIRILIADSIRRRNREMCEGGSTMHRFKQTTRLCSLVGYLSFEHRSSLVSMVYLLRFRPDACLT